MHYPLMDITDRIPEPPTWWMNGIPRYGDYDPQNATWYETNLLVRIICPYCYRVFDVAIGTNAVLQKDTVHPMMGYPLDSKTGDIIEEAYDDPPFHLKGDGFNCMGNTAPAEWVAILQVWERDNIEWKRRFDLDGPSPESPI